MRKLTLLSLGMLLLASSCSNGDSRCDNLAGTTGFCLNGTYYEPTFSNWAGVGGTSLTVTLVENDGTFPSATVFFSLWNTANDDIPEVGSYTVVQNVPTPNGTRMARVSGQYYPDGTTVNLIVDTTAAQTFEITAFDAGTNKLTGYYEGTVMDMNNNLTKYTFKAGFTDVTP